MSQEIYVKQIPKSCVGCKYFTEHRRQCNLELCLQWNEVKFKFDDCPLIDIKTHDRALVKEVCEKIRKRARIECGSIYSLLSELADEIQKEHEK